MLRKHIRGAAGTICLLTLPLGVAAAPSAGDPEQGKAAAAVCASCHQVDGSGQNNPNGESWPRLAGLDAGYIARQLQAYKAGTRQNPSMQAFAQMLDDQQIADVSAWFASLPATAGQSAAAQGHSEELLKRGEQLATEGDWSKYIVPCSSCHGPDNLGAGTVFPAIAGQHFGYIRDQLLAWQQGARKNDPQRLMATIAERMSSDDINAVAAWLSSQPATAEQ